MFGESKLKFDYTDGISVEMKLEDFFLKIRDRTIRAHEKGRPVFIFFKDS